MPDNAPELIELFQNELAGIDSQFQFWITITFAVVVASHLARDQLSKSLRSFIAILYALAVVLLGLRLGAHVQGAEYVFGVLSDLGVEYPRGRPVMIGWLRRVLVVLGSLGAIFFIAFGPTGGAKSASSKDAP